jgi:hypothetical protein
MTFFAGLRTCTALRNPTQPLPWKRLSAYGLGRRFGTSAKHGDAAT